MVVRLRNRRRGSFDRDDCWVCVLPATTVGRDQELSGTLGDGTAHIVSDTFPPAVSGIHVGLVADPWPE